MNTKLKSKQIVVVANDAGGAEILAAYIEANPSDQFISYVAGPAARIFEREGLGYQAAEVGTIKQVLNQHLDADLVLTGTGWMTPIERLAIVEAKKLGIKSAAFLDHWVNYRERFAYPEPDWQSNLPDEIWAGDEEAEKLARSFFPILPICLVPNPYFASFVARYQKLSRTGDEGRGLLFIGEPNSYAAAVLEALLGHLVTREFREIVILRPHPAESEERYEEIFNHYSGRLAVSVSRNRNILEDLMASKVVVGMESAALVLALRCGKPTVSLITDPAIECPLPSPGILRLNKAEDLVSIDKFLV